MEKLINKSVLDYINDVDSSLQYKTNKISVNRNCR